MSVVVRMEMPKSCDDCDIAIKYQRFGTEIQCPFLGWYADYDNCPVLLQLPEGHGRLVDADDFIKHLFTKWQNGEISNSEWCDIRKWVNEETTIVPAERSEE